MFAQDERGATLVEFALVTPVLILCLVVCFDFARAVNAYITVANAAREGVRYASIVDSPTDSSVGTYLSTRLAPLDASAVTVSVAHTTPPNSSWSPSAPEPTKFTVVVSYTWHSSTWLVGRFFAAASGSPTFSSSSSMEAVR